MGQVEPSCHTSRLKVISFEVIFRNTHTADRMHHTITKWLVKAKFHYASWFEAGSKLVADRFEAKFHYAIWFEAGRQPASNQIA